MKEARRVELTRINIYNRAHSVLCGMTKMNGWVVLWNGDELTSTLCLCSHRLIKHIARFNASRGQKWCHAIMFPLSYASVTGLIWIWQLEKGVRTAFPHFIKNEDLFQSDDQFHRYEICIWYLAQTCWRGPGFHLWTSLLAQEYEVTDVTWPRSVICTWDSAQHCPKSCGTTLHWRLDFLAQRMR